MQRCAFIPYEGKEPYIFISYAHKDSHLVFPILEELNRRGYRVWYDDGIAPGSEWPENIAQHLDGSSLTLAFVSPNSIASANCRREITFALSKQKAFLAIMLQETEMSLGMEMQLSAQQCILKYAYTSDEDFYHKICSCPDLEPCLRQPEAVIIPAPQPVVPVAAPQEVPSAAPKPAPKAKTKPARKKLFGIIAGVVAAVLLLTIPLGGVGLGLFGNFTNGLQSSSNETTLHYSNQTITSDDIRHISQQSQLQTLEIDNCVIESNALDLLTLPETVTQLSLHSCRGISNWSNLLSTQLTKLTLVDCDISDASLSTLPGQNLRTVNISGNPNFTNLGIFANCAKLERLNFSNTGVSSLEPLAGMSGLYAVNGSYTQVTDLTVVANMTTLREVSFAGCGIQSIETPFLSLHLETLDMSYNQLSAFSGFSNCTVLESVNLSHNALYNVDELEKSVATLETLNVSSNPGVYDYDLDFLNSCPKMRTLIMDGLNFNSLDFISELEGLEYLSAANSRIQDISALQKLTNLHHLNLAFNRFSDISVLAQIANENMVLDLSFNNYLTDVSALPAMRYTYLNLVNEYLDPHTVPAAHGEVLVLYYSDNWLSADCLKEENRDTFAQLVVLGCPLDKIISTETRFGKDRIVFMEERSDYVALLELYKLDAAYFIDIYG